MTDLPVTRNPQTITITPENDPYLRYANAAERTRIVGKLLKFNKFGEWVAGETNQELPDDARLIVQMDEFYIGWIKWQDMRPVEQIMGRVIDNFEPPRRSALGDNDKDDWPVDNNGAPRDPWQYSNYLIMMDQTGELYTYATASNGGLQALARLSKAYSKGRWTRPGLLPVVELKVGGYDHPNRQFGHIKTPDICIVHWVDRGIIDGALAAREAGSELPEEDTEIVPPAKLTKPAKNDYRAAKEGAPIAAKASKARF
jgi:hypothetical protein